MDGEETFEQQAILDNILGDCLVEFAAQEKSKDRLIAQPDSEYDRHEHCIALKIKILLDK